MIPKPKNRVRWSALVQSWAFIQEQADTVRCYHLTDKQAAGLRSIAEYLGWPNRYTDNPLPNWLDTSNYRAEVENALLTPTDCETMKIRQSPDNNCVLQVSYDNGATWATAFDYGLCGGAIITLTYSYNTTSNTYQYSTDNGATWLDCEPQPNTQPPILPIPSGLDKWTAARNTAATIRQLAEAWADAIELSANQTDLVNRMRESFGWWVPQDQIAAIATGIQVVASIFALIDAAVLRLALSDQSVWDELACDCYCAIEDDFTYTAANVTAIGETNYTRHTFPLSDMLKNAIFLAGVSGMSNAARYTMDISAYPAEANCNCEWCYTIDFTATNGGFTALVNANGTYGTHTAQGWLSSWFGASQFTYQQNCYISRSLSATITEVTIEFNSPNGCTMALAVNGSTVLAETYFDAGQQSLTWQGNQAITDIILTDYKLNQTENDNIAITRLTLHGTGANPFGESNCP